MPKVMVRIENVGTSKSLDLGQGAGLGSVQGLIRFLVIQGMLHVSKVLLLSLIRLSPH